MSSSTVELGGFPTPLGGRDGKNFSVRTLISRLTLKNDRMILAEKKNCKTIDDDNHTCPECSQIQHLISTLLFDFECSILKMRRLKFAFILYVGNMIGFSHMNGSQKGCCTVCAGSQ